MFLFRSEKKLGHKQTTLVGFVIAIMSLLITAIIAYMPPLVIGFLYKAGVGHLELYFILFNVVLFLSLQALVLFGFPIFYAKDKNDHMAGFQILLYGLMWMILLFTAVVLLSTQLFAVKTPSVDDLQSVLGGETSTSTVPTGTTDVTTDPSSEATK